MPPILESLTRKPTAPTSRLAMDLAGRAQDVYGMDPSAERLGMLPYPQGALASQTGPVDWTDWTAPQFVYDMAKSSVLPGHVAQGGEWSPKDVTQMAMDLGGTGSAVGTAPVGSLGIFAGRRAKTADVGKLKRAERMRDAGSSRDDIWNETGWFQDVDGKWKYEIDDSDASFRRTVEHPEYGRVVARTVEDAYKHPEAIGAYPELGQIHVADTARTGSGSYDRELGLINIGRGGLPKAETSTALHELQHAIQGRDGFAHGGSPEQFAGSKQAATESPTSLYRRLAGEAEARNVQARQDFTLGQRAAQPPWQTLDTPQDELIVRTVGAR